MNMWVSLLRNSTTTSTTAPALYIHSMINNEYDMYENTTF